MKKYTRKDDNQKVLHSPSLCYHNDTLYCSFYECFHEGHTQRVVILKKNGDDWDVVCKLAPGTGNPVIFSLNGQLYIAFSKFKGSVRNIKHVPTLWRNVDTFIGIIKNNKVTLVQNYQNLCPRCAPLNFDNACLLPLYDETLRVGINILFKIQSDDHNETLITRHSIIGGNRVKLIQPTLYFDCNNKIAFEGRNFSRVNYFSPVGIYTDGRNSNSWECTYDRYKTNYNESVLVFNYHKKIYRVFGKNIGRTDLMLNQLGNPESKVIKLNTLAKGCYPNYCSLPNDCFAVCFTEYQERLSDITRITIKTFNENLEQKSVEYI